MGASITSTSTMLGLDDSCIACILCHLICIQDVLRLARTCARLHAVVMSHDPMWQQLFHASFPNALPSEGSVQCYCQLFKNRWKQAARETRLQNRVQRMRLQSDVAQLRRELGQLKEQLHKEQKLQKSLDQQLRQVHCAQLARHAKQEGHWQLAAVQVHQNKILQASPVQLDVKLADLLQQKKVSQLQMQTLKLSTCERSKRLVDKQRRLAALNG